MNVIKLTVAELSYSSSFGFTAAGCCGAGCVGGGGGGGGGGAADATVVGGRASFVSLLLDGMLRSKVPSLSTADA